MSSVQRNSSGPKKVLPSEEDVFNNFWEYVRRAELDIQEYGHLGCPPPSIYGDPWNQEFADAYTAIEPYLKKYRGEYFAFPPGGMNWRSIPHRTLTAHQGLMEFLNPTFEVYGCPCVMDSKEYLAIKNAAILELQERQRDKTEMDQQGREGKLLDKKLILMQRLNKYHNPPKKGRVLKSLTIEQMVELFRVNGELMDGWQYSSIRRLLLKIYPGKGIQGYHEHYATDIDRSGHTDELEDGSHVHDGVINTNATYRANKCKK